MPLHPITHRTIAAAPSRLVQRWLELSRLERCALVDDAAALSFRALHARAQALAQALAASGLGGVRVGLLAPQDHSWVEGFLAILLAGSAVVPISPLHPAREQASYVDQSGALALLVAEGGATAPLGLAIPVLPFREGRLLSAAAQSWRAQRAEPGEAESQTALLLFTSGTTGRPKGVPLSHYNVFEGVQALGHAWQLDARDTLLHALPLHHLHGICVALLTALLSGASVRLLPRYDAARVIEAVSSASVLMGVPTQHRLLADHVAKLGLDARERAAESLCALRLLTSGSAKLSEPLGASLSALSGQYPLERYGMTEVGIVLANPLHGERRPGSCGVALPGCEIRVVDEQGLELPSGSAGELWIRAPSVFCGYDGDSEASARAFSSGFFKSGDTAVQSADGYVQLLGRTSVDIIKSGGYKLSALEIEEHLQEHPDVQEVAVVGLADELWGERVVAAVVLKGRRADAAAFGAELCDWLRQRIAGYKVPKQVAVVSELPRNSMGKVQKPALVRALTLR